MEKKGVGEGNWRCLDGGSGGLGSDFAGNGVGLFEFDLWFRLWRRMVVRWVWVGVLVAKKWAMFGCCLLWSEKMMNGGGLEWGLWFSSGVWVCVCSAMCGFGLVCVLIWRMKRRFWSGL